MKSIIFLIGLFLSVSLADEKPDEKVVKEVQYAIKLTEQAKALVDEGSPRQAVDVYLKAISILRKNLRGNNADVANVFNNLALTYDMLEEFRKALEYKKKSYEMIKALYGDGDHSNVAIALNNIGLTYYKMGDYENVLQYYTKALAMLNRLHNGKDHKEIATLLNNIGSSYDSLGNYTEALESYNKSNEMYKRLNEKNKEDSNIAVTYNNIASTYYKQGKYEEALENYNQALKLYRAIHRGENVDIATCYNNIAVQHEKMGQVAGLNKALEFYRRALTMYRHVFKDAKNHPDIKQANENIKRVLDKLEDFVPKTVDLNSKYEKSEL
jgi:tetratricopeptide (TPR) repeat protein